MEISKFEAKSMFGLVNSSIQNLCFCIFYIGKGAKVPPCIYM